MYVHTLSIAWSKYKMLLLAWLQRSHPMASHCSCFPYPRLDCCCSWTSYVCSCTAFQLCAGFFCSAAFEICLSWALGAILSWMVSFSKNSHSLFTQYLMCMYVCVHVNAHVCVCAHVWLPEVILECHSSSAFVFLRQPLTGTPGLPVRPGRLAMEPQGQFVSAFSTLLAHQLFTWVLWGLNSGPHASIARILPSGHLPAPFIWSESFSVPPAH